MLSVQEAQKALADKAQCLCDTELLPLGEALNRIVAENIVSEINVPPADNSAMDGYAICLADTQTNAHISISQRITADSVPEKVTQRTAARIFTGGAIPEGADTVVMQENAEAVSSEESTESAKVIFRELPAKPGAHIRRKGQDISAGETILEKGTKLRAQEIGLLASIGMSKVRVFKQLTVAVISTGSELIEPGQPLTPGKIYNSNQRMLCALVEALGMQAINLGICPDNLESTKEYLAKAASKADIILTSGGASVGEEDHIKNAVSNLGEIDLWKVAIKPGKPFLFGKVNETSFIGLPGNPASVFTTFLILARPFLLRRQGLKEPSPDSHFYEANIHRPEGQRDQYLQAKLVNNRIEIYPNQSSGVLSSTSWAEGFAIQPKGVNVEPGTKLEFIPYNSLLG